jgi:hypothetical protein
MDPRSGGAERDQYRKPVFPSVSGEAYVTLDPYGGVRQVPEFGIYRGTGSRGISAVQQQVGGHT